MSDPLIHPNRQSSHTTGVLRLEELSPLPFQQPTIHQITDYLCSLLESRLTPTTTWLTAPSISELSAAWQCAHLDTYDAFRELRRREFDFELRGFDQPIRLWRQDTVKSSSKRRNA